ncbi:MAG: SBBP repeat-containing protein [Candidatus Zixiibacteriota bacterium]
MTGLTSQSVIFTRNDGQWDPEVNFRATAGDATIWLCRDAIVWQFSGPAPVDAEVTAVGAPKTPRRAAGRGQTVTLRSEFIGAGPATVLTGEAPLSHRSNYFLGADPSAWRTDVPSFEAVTYRNLYPGVDLHLNGEQGELRCRWTFRAGADRSKIAIRHVGNTPTTESGAGALQVKTPWGTNPIIALDPRHGESVSILGAPTAAGTSEASSTSLALAYSTFLDGGSFDEGYGVAVDDAGNVYVTGLTSSLNYPTQGAYDGSANGGNDVFITKLSPTGTSLVYSTFVGGSSDDAGRDIAIDPDGNAYVTGVTESSDFPTQNAYDAGANGLEDFFVLKLSSAGNALDYSTYLGGANIEDKPALAVDAAGSTYITGLTWSSDYPSFDGYDGALSGAIDAVVTKLTPSGNTLDYSTFLGGAGLDEGYDIALNALGNAYITGVTQSTSFPTVNPHDNELTGPTDLFVSKLSVSGASLVYSTFLGGSSGEYQAAIAVDGSGNAYVTGMTASTDFPTQNPFDATYTGGFYDLFVTKLSVTGNELIYSTFLGGSDEDHGRTIAVDAAGSAYIAALTYSADYPTINPYDAGHNGNVDVVITKLTPSGSALSYSTFFGGSVTDDPYGIAVDAAGSTYVTGLTHSVNFPTRNPIDGTINGSNAAFVFRLLPASPFTVTSLDNSGPGTLRDILTIANGNSARDSVIFGIAGVINLLSPLPACSDAGGGIVIDGFSAPGDVILDGASAGSGPGLEFGSEGGQGNIVRGLTIQNFPGAGVSLPQIATRTTVSECLFHGNAGPPIDLWGDGFVLANDPGDADAGPNTLLNYPGIDTVFLVGSDTFYIAGTTAPNATVELYLAELYLGGDTVAHANDHGEAWRHLGTQPASGSGHFAFPEVPVRAWSYVTATATDASGNTSEFALNRLLIPDSLTITAYSPVVLTLISPSGQDSIGRDIITGGFNTIGPTATYDSLTDYSDPPDGDPDDRIIITNIEPGEYTIRVTTKPGDPGTGYVLGIRVDGTNEVYAKASGGTSTEPETIPVPGAGESDTYSFKPSSSERGDLNADAFLDAVDLALMIDMVFFGLPLPQPQDLADINCDTFTDAVDLAVMIDAVFFGGSIPCR